MWIPDVSPRQTISSAQWGNPVRDRIVQTFADMTEANSHLAVLPDGALAWIGGDARTFVKRGGAWRFLEPRAVSIPGLAYQIVQGVPEETARLNIPAGYTSALVHYMSNVAALTSAMNAEFQMQVASSGASVGLQTATMSAAGQDGLASISILCSVALAGDQVAVFTSATGAGAVETNGDARIHQLSALCLP